MAQRKSSSKSELDALIKEKQESTSDGANDNENADGTKGAQGAGVVPKNQKLKRKKKEPFKKTLEKILSMRVSENLVSEAVFLTCLGRDISYQEAILLSLVIKAANGDVQAANFIREASGNKQNSEDEKEKCPKFEDL